MKKLKSNQGISTVLVVLLVADLVLALIFAVPLINYVKEQERIQQDKGHETVAEDSALMKYLADGSFEAVYGATEKEFFEIPDILEVKPYGSAKEHQGMVLIVKADEEGKITLTWVDPEEYLNLSIN